MKQYKMISFTAILSFVLFLGAVVSSINSTVIAAETDITPNAEAAILLDGETGQVLYEKNADTALGVASMAKMMTEYLVLEAIEEGRISWDQDVLINEYIYNLSRAPGLSNVGLTQGEAYTVEELYRAMAIFSGNAATVALAEVVAGTETEFVKQMNDKAAELGLEDYKFVNSTGLNNSSLLGQYPEGTGENEENVMSARDTAKLAYRLLQDYPEVLDTASVSRLEFRDGRSYPNFNWMLPGLIYEYEGVDGLKTGSTEFAGYGFTATAERDGQRFISVVMKTASQEERFSETRALLNYAFSSYSEQEVLEDGFVPEQDSITVEKGKEAEIAIAGEGSLNLLLESGEAENYKPVVVLDEESLTAPVEAGQQVGTIELQYTGEGSSGFIDGDDKMTVPLVTQGSVEKANWFVLMFRGIGDFFAGLWGTVIGWF
ncbi:D-alanyl-D-alanine carboxypeptidase family protein [Bacillus fonticola]|uniref:D-alanyl-D-alanine carboxypeptidase family protein n=1 Tax=Bacillus fonticola TaxID=2728853 RepID=UPI00147353C1|nr:D-alanyl-D-alanine carboxypeptidase family protein [Bacillus fonticola]